MFSTPSFSSGPTSTTSTTSSRATSASGLSFGSSATVPSSSSSFTAATSSGLSFGSSATVPSSSNSSTAATSSGLSFGASATVPSSSNSSTAATSSGLSFGASATVPKSSNSSTAATSSWLSFGASATVPSSSNSSTAATSSGLSSGSSIFGSSNGSGLSSGSSIFGSSRASGFSFGSSATVPSSSSSSTAATSSGLSFGFTPRASIPCSSNSSTTTTANASGISFGFSPSFSISSSSSSATATSAWSSFPSETHVDRKLNTHSTTLGKKPVRNPVARSSSGISNSNQSKSRFGKVENCSSSAYDFGTCSQSVSSFSFGKSTCGEKEKQRYHIEVDSQLRESLKDLIECPICFEVYNNPKMLPCQHIFCYGCLQKWEAEQSRSTIQCPQCNQSLNLAPSGVSGLSGAIHVNKIIESMAEDHRKELKTRQEEVKLKLDEIASHIKRPLEETLRAIDARAMQMKKVAKERWQKWQKENKQMVEVTGLRKPLETLASDLEELIKMPPEKVIARYKDLLDNTAPLVMADSLLNESQSPSSFPQDPLNKLSLAELASFLPAAEPAKKRHARS